MKKKFFAIDRFEENFAVLEDEDESHINVLRSKLPIGVNEGDVMFLLDGHYFFDKEETERRRNYIIEKLKILELRNNLNNDEGENI